MSQVGRGPVAQLGALVDAAARSLRGGGEGESGPAPRLERPKRGGQGDYSTNAAMLLAPALATAPREIAERLGERLRESLGEELERVEVAGPGFLNLFMSDAWYRAALRAVLAAGPAFGAGTAVRQERILIEFVSANPTGPLVAASGRHAAYGDTLARILEHYGHRVEREYYLNDAGNQVRLFGESVRARARGEEVPEGGYQGEYVRELAAEIPQAAERAGAELAADAVAAMVRRIQGTLERYGVRFDRFFSERSLHDGTPSRIEQAIGILRERGHVYESEGAVWLRTTSFGDDKDRVAIRSSGEPTYLAGDVAYIQDKLERGYDRQLIPLASDHHAYIRELKSVIAALGGAEERLEVPVLQFVHLVEGEERTAMSKRRGAFVTLDELLDEIGVDATRFFMLQRSHDRTLDLDVGLARSQSAENPVYYVQYAHARIASMLRRVGEERVVESVSGAAGWDAQPLHPSERALVRKLVDFPGELVESAERRAPHRMAGYALELAQEFTAFYRDCRVVGAERPGLEAQRLALSVAAQRLIALTLGLLGVSAPESM